MVGNGVHHDVPRQEVAATDKNEDNELGRAKDFPANAAKEDLARIRHVVHLGISQLELAHDIGGVGRDDTQAD